MSIKIFADTSDISLIKEYSFSSSIQGFTTNPTLMRKAGVTNYLDFAQEAITNANGKPISFEVIADDFIEMERQAKILSRLDNSVYVKIPISNTKGDYSFELISRLQKQGIKLNITAVLTLQQILNLNLILSREVPAIVSVFAGRIADTGRDPVPYMIASRDLLPRNVDLLWASSRQVLNVTEADKSGANIITLTPELIKKTDMQGLDLHQLSLQTVTMFYNDALAAGYIL